MATNPHPLQRDSMAKQVKQGTPPPHHAREAGARHTVGGTPDCSRPQYEPGSCARGFARTGGDGSGHDRAVQRKSRSRGDTAGHPGSLHGASVVGRPGGTLAAPQFKGSVNALREEATAIRNAARKKNVELYALHDINFHRIIVQGASNRILLRTWDSLAFEVRIQLWLSKGKVDLLSVQEAHWQIIDALEKGEGNRAGKLLRDHIFVFAGV
jgi:FCD domain